jgi:hypothetical protein
MPVKRVLCPERLRRVPAQFSWVDHRLVRDKYISRCSSQALALYLFLVTVGDAEGLSYYSDASICRLLSVEPSGVDGARRELIAMRLIAHQKPLYQVLALDPERVCLPARRPLSAPLPLAQILSEITEERP